MAFSFEFGDLHFCWLFVLLNFSSYIFFSLDIVQLKHELGLRMSTRSFQKPQGGTRWWCPRVFLQQKSWRWFDDYIISKQKIFHPGWRHQNGPNWWACLSTSLQPTTVTLASSKKTPEEPVTTPMIVPRLGFFKYVQLWKLSSCLRRFVVVQGSLNYPFWNFGSIRHVW